MTSRIAPIACRHVHAPRARRGWRRIRLLAVIALTVAVASAPPAGAQDGRQVWAFYMGFWNTASSWDRQADVLDDRPQLGNYDARDPGTVATQIAQAKGAGIDAFVVAWRGSWDATATDALSNVLDQAAANGFRAAAVLDQFDGGDHARTVASLRYLVDHRIDHPGYLRYRGKPVILFAFQGAFDWRSIRNQVDPGRRTLWIAEGLRGERLYGGAMDGMYAFNFAWADGQPHLYQRDLDATLRNGGSVFVPTIHPGWDEDKIARRDGRGNPTSRRDRANGEFLRRGWEGATSIGTDVVLVVSWNEYMENSHIEPSARYGTQALDVLRPLVTAWKSGSTGPGPVVGPGPGLGPDGSLVDEADRRQLIQFNPDATLQKRIFRDGFVPNSGEFDVAAAGRDWRGQRAEHLGTGQVRVYYTPIGDWADVRSAQRGASEGDPVGLTLLAEGQRRQLIQFNPGASLQKRIFADGFVPNSPEFRSGGSGSEHIAQRAEHLGSGEVRVYHAPTSDYGRVGFLRGQRHIGGGPPPVQPEPPQPPQPGPSGEPVQRIEAWDARRGQWLRDEVVLPPEDVCTRIRWHTANIDQVYLEHVGYGSVPGTGEIGDGEILACLEAADRREQRWILHVLHRDGQWVESVIRLRSE